MTNLSASPTQLHRHREQFPALASKTYFNYGGQGPMPQRVMDTITQAQAHIQQLGPFGTEVNRWITEEVNTTRVEIASYLNVAPTNITITEDVTIGCNIAMWGIDWHPGDHLLLSDCEHPGVIAIAGEISNRFAVEVTTCPLLSTSDSGDPTEVVLQHLRPNTRLVVLSHILWNTGQILPIDKIAKVCTEKNVQTLIDAAQSVGVLPLNLTELGADYYAFTGHKWLCGPGGVGGLYVRPEAAEKLKPTFIGWRGVICNNQAQPVDFYPDGRRYEVATSNYALYPGLREAIATHQKWGTAEERYQDICRNSEYLWRNLTALTHVKCLLPYPPQSGLVSFQLTNNQPQTSQQLVDYLESQKFFTRTIANPNCVRACVHYFTLESEIDQLVEQIQKFSQP
jgi:L-cysteine/cystine lyase